MSRESGAGALTRRAVLRGAAVAGAAALVAPESVVAAPVGRRRGVFSRWVGSLAGGESSAIAAPRTFSLVGVEWSAPERARIELRTHLAGGGWSAWVTASVTGHDPDRPPAGAGAVAVADRFGEPIWVGPSEEVELRSADAVRGVRLHFVGAARPARPVHAAAALPLAAPILDAGPGQPPIIARATWARGQAPPSRGPVYGTIKLAFVHHSEGPNGYAPADVPSILMSIFDYHRYVRGFFDIAYNFAVDAFGRIWEARAGGIDEPVRGAHAGGYNGQSTGVVVLGTFTGVAPSAAAIDALEHLLAWKLALHGVPALGRVTAVVDSGGAIYTAFGPGAHVSLPRVAGHRDGDQTSCPGDVLYGQLPSIRPRVAQLAGSPVRLRIAAPPAAVSAGSAVTITGRLTELASGRTLPGVPVEIQQVGARGRETGLATVMTDGAGGWSFTLTAAANTLLRALHPSGPAAVSDVVVIAVAPVLTLTLDSSAPLRVSGTVSPVVPQVKIDLYRLAGGQRHLVSSRRASAGRGAFRARLHVSRPGRYVVVALTPASARYAAGSSAPLTVTV